MAASHYFHCLRVCKQLDELGSLVPGISEYMLSTCDEKNEQNTLFFTN
jgi:hypothetical protein